MGCTTPSVLPSLFVFRSEKVRSGLGYGAIAVQDCCGSGKVLQGEGFLAVCNSFCVCRTVAKCLRRKAAVDYFPRQKMWFLEAQLPPWAQPLLWCSSAQAGT